MGFFSIEKKEEKEPLKEVPLVFKNKKEAIEAFKALLKEKVCSFHHFIIECIIAQY